MAQMDNKTSCKDFNGPINVVFFCRNINIGKIKAEKKHRWFVDVEIGGLSET